MRPDSVFKQDDYEDDFEGAPFNPPPPVTDEDDEGDVPLVTIAKPPELYPSDPAKRKAVTSKCLSEITKLQQKLNQTTGAQGQAAIRRSIDNLERRYKMLTGILPPFPELDDQNKPRLCEENLTALLDHLNVEVVYDGATNTKYMRGDVFNHGQLAVTEDVYMDVIRSKADRVGLPITNTFNNTLNTIMNHKRSHPRREWLLSKPWDGVDRFEDLWQTLRVREEYAEFKPLYRQYLYAWCVSVAKAGLVPMNVHDGFAVAGLLVLQGPQHRGKTEWTQALLPAHEPWSRSGAGLDPRDKDDVLQIIKYWIVELGESEDKINDGTVQALKRWTTNSTDVIRMPYGKQALRFPRRTVIVSTLNSERFLVDATGNRRYWVIPVSSCVVTKGFVEGVKPLDEMDLQQLWAQFAHIAQNDRDNKEHRLSQEMLEWNDQANRLHTRLEVLDKMSATVTTVKQANKDMTSAAAEQLHEVEREILRLFEIDTGLPHPEWVTARDVRAALHECSNVVQQHYPDASDRWTSRHVTAHICKLVPDAGRRHDRILNVGKYAMRRRT